MPDSTRDRYRSLLQRAAPHCPKTLRTEIDAALSAAGTRGPAPKIDRQEILRLRAEGSTAAEIGESLGCSEGYAARVIREQAQ